MLGALSHLIHPHRQWLVLGFSVLGLTTSVTMLVFYLPVVLSQITGSQLAIGFAVGVEGVVALTVPLIVGQASDRTWNRFGRRLPYMLAATPLVVLGLLAAAYASSYWLIVGAVIIFFAGYYTYYTAYQALYPDMLPANEYGRAWSFQNIFQGIGVALALLGGGALIGTSLKIPFLAGAALFAVVAAATALLIKEKRHPRQSGAHFYQAFPNFLRRLRADRNLRLFLAAHFCWEYTLAAIRAFVILYLLKGLGVSEGTLFMVLSLVIVAYLVAAIVSGNIIDRFDPRRYSGWVVFLFACGMLVAGLTTDTLALQLMMPFGVFAGAATLMLAYPILLRVTPAERRGEYTGYFQFNRGLALLLGTSLTGFLIDTFGSRFPLSAGYQVLWLTTAALTFASLPFLLSLTSGGTAKAR